MKTIFKNLTQIVESTSCPQAYVKTYMYILFS